MTDRTYAHRPAASSTAPSFSPRSASPRDAAPAPAAGPAHEAELAAQIERAERFGHHFARISVARPQPATGEMPIQRVEILPEERARPEQFMRARAHLAAMLTGASVGELQTEVQKSRTQVNRWESTKDNNVTTEQAQGVLNETLREDYTTAKRFQSEAGHYTPRTGQDFTAVEQVRALHGGEYSVNTAKAPDEPGLPLHFDAAYAGARHTKGYNESDFVSLAQDPAKLLTSQDDGPKGAQTIANKAPHLHTYTFPKIFGWDTERLSATLEKIPGTLQSEIDGPGQKIGEWLGSTPRQEGEVLFHGGNLNKYRTRQEVNPYLPKKKKR